MVELRFHSSVRVALAALSVLSAVTVADAATAPAKPKLTETITCRDFVQMREEFKPAVVSYALGYTHAKQPQLDAVDVGVLRGSCPCWSNPAVPGRPKRCCKESVRFSTGCNRA